jgi:hypothetical protein
MILSMGVFEQIRERALSDAVTALYESMKVRDKRTMYGSGIYRVGFFRKRDAGPYWVLAGRGERAAQIAALVNGENVQDATLGDLDSLPGTSGLTRKDANALRHGTIPAWNEMARTGQDVLIRQAKALLDGGGREPICVVFARGADGLALMQRAVEAGMADAGMLNPHAMLDEISQPS